MQLGMIGLGRMGGNIVRRLMKHGHTSVVYMLEAQARHIVGVIKLAQAKGCQAVDPTAQAQQRLGIRTVRIGDGSAAQVRETSGEVVVLPLLYEPCELPEFLKGKMYADFSKPEEYEAMLAKLLRRLRIT